MHSVVAAPVTNFLCNKAFASKSARKFPIEWGQLQQGAFHSLKNALLLNQTVLSFPSWSDPFYVAHRRQHSRSRSSLESIISIKIVHHRIRKSLIFQNGFQSRLEKARMHGCPLRCRPLPGILGRTTFYTDDSPFRPHVALLQL